ncbi:uncharacterized protein LOC110732843 [Chenopodium quinoa]|uniref:uncharacterized protein LOC110732843 n=1 Tax=Chenopodium quinoa TaxID=63459 RepID=UPI000B76FA72|nr:uncharacterized protein LOC110732843 [Chenopodium quinoa]
MDLNEDWSPSDDEIHGGENDVNIRGHSFDLNQLPVEETGANVHNASGNQHINDSATNQEEQRTNAQATNQGSTHHRHQQVRLNSEDKFNVLIFLLKYHEGDDIKRGAIKATMEHFNLKRKCVSSVWNEAKKQKQALGKYKPCTNYHLAGRKRITVPVGDITKLGIGERSCIRDVATNLNISKSTVGRMIKRGDIKAHTNVIKPPLTEANKLARLKWILGLIMGSSPWKMSRYFPMYDFVHIDEKWFKLTKKSHRYYIAKNEKGVH